MSEVSKRSNEFSEDGVSAESSDSAAKEILVMKVLRCCEAHIWSLCEAALEPIRLRSVVRAGAVSWPSRN